MKKRIQFFILTKMGSDLNVFFASTSHGTHLNCVVNHVPATHVTLSGRMPGLIN